MQFTLSSTENLQKFVSIFSSMKNVSDAINMHLTPEGVYCQTLDMGHICMCELKLSSNWFDNYKCEGEYIIGLNTKIISIISSCHEDKQSIIWSYDADREDTLSIAYNSKDEESKEFNKEFEVPLIDLETDIMNIPDDSEWQMDIVIMSKRFSKIMAQFEMFGDEFTCTGTENELTFTSSGDFGKLSAKVDNSNLEEYSIEEDTKVSVSYALKYMKLITSFSRLSHRTIANFSTELPLRVQYSMDTIDDEDVGLENVDESSAYIRFFLAPKLMDY